MRAFVIDSSAQLGRVRLASIEQGQPASGEVSVQIRAVSLNPVDNKLIDGGHPAWRYPHVPGVDGAGVITTVGPDVSTWQPGDRVYFHANLARDGTFAEYVTVPGTSWPAFPITLHGPQPPPSRARVSPPTRPSTASSTWVPGRRS